PCTKPEVTMATTASRLGALLRPVAARLLLLASIAFAIDAQATGRIVVGHDINTLASNRARSNEVTFAVNVATFLTANSPTKKILLFESRHGDVERDFAENVRLALLAAGFAAMKVPDYTTPFATFDAIFVAEDYPELGFLDNQALISYVNGGGGVYLAGGVG